MNKRWGIVDLFNRNFNKGLSIHQMFLMAVMVGGAVLDNQFLILFSMMNCVLGYFEPNTSRYAIKLKEKMGK